MLISFVWTSLRRSYPPGIFHDWLPFFLQFCLHLVSHIECSSSDGKQHGQIIGLLELCHSHLLHGFNLWPQASQNYSITIFSSDVFSIFYFHCSSSWSCLILHALGISLGLLGNSIYSTGWAALGNEFAWGYICTDSVSIVRNLQYNLCIQRWQCLIMDAYPSCKYLHKLINRMKIFVHESERSQIVQNVRPSCIFEKLIKLAFLRLGSKIPLWCSFPKLQSKWSPK